MQITPETVALCRSQFPALARSHAGQPCVFLDGPAGTQVPQRVIDAVSDYYRNCNANHGGLFATSTESDSLLDEAHRTLADLLGADDPDTVFFGQNMTSLTFALSRSLARTWGPDDEILVTRLDHDANVTPWVLAARDCGATVKFVEINSRDCTLDLDDLRAKLNFRTSLVAVGCASNSVGTLNPIREICRLARENGSLVFLDAVHYAPHALIDVRDFGCDFLACSAYKFFGPHLGVMWGRRELLERLPAYKVRPAPDTLPGKLMSGTQSHESIVGAMAAVEYLADLGRTVSSSPGSPRRDALRSAFAAITEYERQLAGQLLTGLNSLTNVRTWGLSDPHRVGERLPTVSITHSQLRPAELAEQLARRGIFAWHGNYYALQLSETLGREPDGMVRLGLVHYNTPAEVERLLAVLAEI